MDRRALTAARTTLHTPTLERAVGAFSTLGEHAAIWLAIGAVQTVRERDDVRRRRWRGALRVVAFAYALNTALKFLVRRPRPALEGLPPLVHTPTRLSFPSAHATTSFAAALAYSRAGAPRAPLYALAVGLSLSRPYLGVHYPSDVLAGALLGSALAAALTEPGGAP